MTGMFACGPWVDTADFSFLRAVGFGKQPWYSEVFGYLKFCGDESGDVLSRTLDGEFINWLLVVTNSLSFAAANVEILKSPTDFFNAMMVCAQNGRAVTSSQSS